MPDFSPGLCGRNTAVVKIWLDGGAKGNRRSFTALRSVQDDKRVEEMAAQLIRDDWWMVGNTEL